MKLALALLALASLCCARPPADVGIAMRTDADRARLVRGWSGFEGLGSPRPFCWVVGTSSKVSLDALPREGTAELRISALPYEPAGLPPQRMAVWLNGASLAVWAMAPEHREYVVRFPARLFTRGPNFLYFVFDRANRPRDVEPGNGDERALAAAVTAIDLRIR